ncbi:hypothetical protein [Thermus sp.]|uniref:hypothetical protein n=1 Tax=Thermus sp. TaxID=275 RepID=UPI003D10CAA0
MRLIKERLVYLVLGVLAFLSAALGQRPPSLETSAGGAKWRLEECQLKDQRLTCRIQVENPSNKPINLQVSPASIMAVSSSGWLYLGQMSPNPLNLGPAQKARVTVSFNNVTQGLSVFPLVRVGEAYFTGIALPSEKLTASPKGWCLFDANDWQHNLLCSVFVVNNSDQDVEITVIPGDSFANLDNGIPAKGRNLPKENSNTLVIPAKGERGFLIGFNTGYFGQPTLPQVANLIRIRTLGGWIEAREIPFRYCGANQDERCPPP